MGVQARNEEEGLKRKLLLTSRGRRERHADAVKIEQAASDGPATIASSKLMLWSLNKLMPATRRVRKTSAAQLERVVRSVKRFGVVAPVLVDKDGRIIDGHIVVEAARALGLATIPVVMVKHLGEMEVRGVRLALNRLGETGEWDLPALSLEVKDLAALDFALVRDLIEAPPKLRLDLFLARRSTLRDMMERLAHEEDGAVLWTDELEKEFRVIESRYGLDQTNDARAFPNGSATSTVGAVKRGRGWVTPISTA